MATGHKRLALTFVLCAHNLQVFASWKKLVMKFEQAQDNCKLSASPYYSTVMASKTRHRQAQAYIDLCSCLIRA